MGIEEKLSAIKAINHEIEQCDQALEALEKFYLSGVDSISIGKIDKSTFHFTILPYDLTHKVMVVMKQTYFDRKNVLVDKARKLMK